MHFEFWIIHSQFDAYILIFFFCCYYSLPASQWWHKNHQRCWKNMQARALMRGGIVNMLDWSYLMKQGRLNLKSCCLEQNQDYSLSGGGLNPLYGVLSLCYLLLFLSDGECHSFSKRYLLLLLQPFWYYSFIFCSEWTGIDVIWLICIRWYGLNCGNPVSPSLFL